MRSLALALVCCSLLALATVSVDGKLQSHGMMNPALKLTSRTPLETDHAMLETRALAGWSGLNGNLSTNSDQAIDYIKPLIGRMHYWLWSSGCLPDGPGAYNGPPPAPDTSKLDGEGIFCAGVGNLLLRSAGKHVPTRGDSCYSGGTGAYWYSPVISGKGYFEDVAAKFSVDGAKSWTSGGQAVLIGRSYSGTGLEEQGHVAILLPSGYVLQSIDTSAGLNWEYTIEESNDGGYYQWMVHPDDWINY